MSETRQPVNVLLVHGLGATGSVWSGVIDELSALGLRVWAPDLPGHGEAGDDPPYTLSRMAAAVHRSIPVADRWLVCGHSLGGYVAVELASGRYGSPPCAAVSLGAKLVFSGADLERAAELAQRPVRWLASHAEAVERYARVAGLGPRVDARLYARGVRAGVDGYRLAQDPRTFGIGVPAFGDLARAALCTVRVVRGADDPMVSRSQCESLGLGCVELDGVGHNAHVEVPGRIAQLIASEIAQANG